MSKLSMIMVLMVKVYGSVGSLALFSRAKLQKYTEIRCGKF
jgi:hypothetical protein